MEHAKLRRENFLLTALGMAVFGLLSIYLLIAPDDFNQRTRTFAISKVQQETEAALADVAASSSAEEIASIAGVFSKRLESEIDALRRSTESGAPELIAEILAAACRLDCERKEAADEKIRGVFNSLIDRYGVALERARSMVVGEYDRVMNELRADLLIFSASTFAAFCAAFLLALHRGAASVHLFPLSITLTLATALAIFWYIFGQDWVLSIIFSDYWGWSYATLLGVLWILLADIAINRARITTEIINAIGQSFGSFSVSPC